MRKAGESQAYLVAWRSDLVVKAGYSATRRWRKFLTLGGTLIAIHQPDDWHDAFSTEATWLYTLSRTGERAFTNRTEAVPYLGHSGSGWVECYRFASPEVMQASLDACVRYIDSDASGNAPGITPGIDPGNART